MNAARSEAAEVRLLVVDDNPAITLLLEALFRHAGWEVATAGDVAGALQQAAGPDWSAAVLDVDLPDGTGFELLAQLRSRPATRAFPAVFITGRPDADRVRTVAALGHALLVPKPFAAAEIVGAVASLLASRADTCRAPASPF